MMFIRRKAVWNARELILLLVMAVFVNGLASVFGTAPIPPTRTAGPVSKAPACEPGKIEFPEVALMYPPHKNSGPRRN